MNASEIKLDLFRKIDALGGDRLKEAYGMLLNYLNNEETEDHWVKISQKEKLAINKGLDQIATGKTKPHADVMTSFREKYSS